MARGYDGDREPETTDEGVPEWYRPGPLNDETIEMLLDAIEARLDEATDSDAVSDRALFRDVRAFHILTEAHRVAIGRALAFIRHYVHGDWYAEDGWDGAPLRIYSDADLAILAELAGGER